MPIVKNEIAYHIDHTIIVNFLGNNIVELHIAKYMLEGVFILYLHQAHNPPNEFSCCTPQSFNDAPWFSTWTPIFDFDAPKDLGLPMWIILHYMPLEYCPIKIVVAIQIDMVLGYDASNASR
jgi:hypothetical protein